MSDTNAAEAARQEAVAHMLAALGQQVDPQLLDLALTHRSYAFEQGGLPTNERLEFLGDSVLGLVVTEELYATHPQRSEGDLARMRASVVNARSLAEVARALGVGPCIRLGRGELTSGGDDKPSILADTMEAIIGAVYLDQGIDVARPLVLRLFGPLMTRAGKLGAGLDWKTSLQEAASAQSLGAPEYRITGDGPDHARVFHAEVVLGGEVWGAGTGSAKKHAEQAAAEQAYERLVAQMSDASGPDATGDSGSRDSAAT